MKTKNIVRLTGLCMLLCAMFPIKAKAQDFYGEGNVLIAVDMGPYRENENVVSLEGTMGTLEWGADAPTGTSTRPAFDNRRYNVPSGTSPVKAPHYEAEIEYTTGQKVFLPYIRYDDPDYMYEGKAGFDIKNTFFTRDQLPQEIFNGSERRFLIHNDYIVTGENGEELFQLFYEQTEDGSIHPCCDFLEIECVSVSSNCTYWQYTGIAYSARTGFDIDDYLGAVELTDSELAFFTDICDVAYEREGETFCDPLWEDMRGDRDRKAAFVALHLDVVEPDLSGYFAIQNTVMAGFDCLVMNADNLPGRRKNRSYDEVVVYYRNNLIHELNHYMIDGCMNPDHREFSMWMGEALAEYSADLINPYDTDYQEYIGQISDFSSRLRMIPGFLWGYDVINNYPNYRYMAYALGSYFLSFIEHETTGVNDGRFWMDFLASQTVGDVSITGNKVDEYLKFTTGESLDAWYARFIAALLTGEDDWSGLTGDELFKKTYRVDTYVFFRSYTDYGKDIGGELVQGAADYAVTERIRGSHMLTAVQGGGTAYAFRNDDGGRIAVTGADERWYFISAYIDLPGEREVIGISSADELAKIGRDPEYMVSGRYRLTADIDLGGKQNPWTPIGSYIQPFCGELDGDGHVISGLYINGTTDYAGLFSDIAGNALVKNLTVEGSVSGCSYVGGIAGYNGGGTIKNCISKVTVTGDINIGGIVGYHYLGTISDCICTGNISGNMFGGGIIGFGSFAVVENCRSICEVKAYSEAGGIAGRNDACEIRECSVEGGVSGDYYIGGIAGGMQKDGTVRNCSFKGKVSGETFTGDIAGLIFDGTVVNPDGSSEDGQGMVYEDGTFTITTSSTDAGGIIKQIRTVSNRYVDNMVIVEYRLDAGVYGALRIRKIDAGGNDILIPDVIRTADGTEYTVTTTAGRAFQCQNKENVILPASIKTITSGTFRGSKIKTITLTAEKASDLKIKKGAFDGMKKAGRTTVIISTDSRTEFDRIVEKCRKAGGTKLKYVYSQRTVTE